MKSQLFKTAWKNFRLYNITFSEALTKAWFDYKRNQLALEFVKIPTKNQFAKKKEQARLALKEFDNSRSFSFEFRNIANTSGAEHYYGKDKFVGRKNALTNVSLL